MGAAVYAALAACLLPMALEYGMDVPATLALRNLFMAAVPAAPAPKYPACSNETMASDMTIVVTVKDSCSQGPGFIEALETFAPPSVHLIYTYPNFKSCKVVDEAAVKRRWDKVTFLPLPLRSSPMVGWVEAIPHITTRYSLLLHNDGYALDSFFGCELLSALKARADSEYAVAAPMLFESKRDGSLGAHATQSNLRLVRDEKHGGAPTVHHDHSVRRALNRGADLDEGEQPDFLEDHGFLIETDKIDSVVDPQASYTMEYLDMIFSLKSNGWKVLFVPTARLEFRITEFSWRDVPYFMYKRAEATCHGTRDYIAAKWKANFPNTGFWTFIKYTIVEQHQWAMPSDMPWSDQSAIVHGFMLMTGFNRFREQSSRQPPLDFISLLENIDGGYSSNEPVVASRTLQRAPVTSTKPINISGLDEILPYGPPTREFPLGLEASMPQEYMPFAIAELSLPSCDLSQADQNTVAHGGPAGAAADKVCGMLIAHGDGGCSCWINLPTFKSNSPVGRFIYDYLAPMLKIPSRIMTYFEMWQGAARLASDHVAPLRRWESEEFRLFVCDGGERCTAEFDFGKADRLVSFRGMPATISDVESAVAEALGGELTHPSGDLDAFGRWCVGVLAVGYELLQYTYPGSRKNPYASVAAVALSYAAMRGAAPLLGSWSTGALAAAVLALAARCAWRAVVLGLSLLAVAPPSLVFGVVSHLVPRYHFAAEQAWRADGCGDEVAERRRRAFDALSKRWKKKFAKCIAVGHEMQNHLSDLRFSSGRVFMPFQSLVGEAFEATTVVESVEGVCLVDLDGNKMQDVSGSYGLNVLGYERYKEFLAAGNDNAQKLSCALGPLNVCQVDNIKMLAKVSGQEECSFHMSGTEAVMCAVRLARFNAGAKPLVVTFNGAYHGWWDGMQPAAGNERVPGDVLCLKDVSALSLTAIRMRRAEIAAVLVNPLQCFHPNAAPPSDLVLASNVRSVCEETAYYREWLQQLRALCTETGITLIFDEVYTGFRLAPGGAQEIFGVKADLVTYGKTVAGGNPIGVVCGPKRLMNRSDTTKPARVAYVIGTFAGAPATMGSMHSFLSWLNSPQAATDYEHMHSEVERFISGTNAALRAAGLPLAVKNFRSIWSMIFTTPGRYHWMLQYYLKDEDVNLSWVGTGRLLFSMDWRRADYDQLSASLLRACERMKQDGWWEEPAGNVKLMVARETAAAFVAAAPTKIVAALGLGAAKTA